MSGGEAILSQFHGLVAKWFGERFGLPTDVQARAWPRIAAGEHVLVVAPTGTGKTLTAFLWAIDRLVSGHWPGGRTSVLYVSPLKALNNDIRRNLLAPLGELRAAFDHAGQDFPPIHVLTRSGDTPAADRRRMVRRPPEILITTPESLNLLLSSPGGRSILTNLATVILDEIHAVIGNRRGTHLITAVERLVRLSGEFQRIALSATVRPLETVAAFVGGLRPAGAGGAPRCEARPVATVRSDAEKRYDIRVRPPAGAGTIAPDGDIWDSLAVELRRIIEPNRSTLVFANSRRLCEMLALKINGGAEQPVAYAHHGSLSREIRHEVERKLKAGELRAIVATNSLEMGIDIGSIDEVVLIQSPPSISACVQRVGRAGHQVGQVSRAELFPSHDRDLLDAAVLARGILDQDIEEVRPIRCPLDVLAQVLVSMVAAQTWNIDELYAFVGTAYPYRDLPRGQFDLVLEMLAGRYADTRIRELKPRVSIDRLDNTVALRPGALQALYLAGGTIPDRGYFQLRHHETRARIGELDEEFVWEADVGQTFALGAQHWQIRAITHNDVFVVPGTGRPTAPPFWRGEQYSRDVHFSRRIAELLELAGDQIEADGFAERLRSRHCMDAAAADGLIDFLRRQKAATKCDLPHRHLVVVEVVSAGPGGAPGNQVVLHTLWGARVNRPYGMALEAAWEERFGCRPEVFVADDCVAIVLPHEVAPEEVLSLVGSANVEELLRRRLEGSGFFGARFRECAGRALLLARGGPNRRMPLWLNRLRSQKLLECVLACDDFPILLEAWRTCLQDEFDLAALRECLADIESGRLAWVAAHVDAPSPMAEAVAWRQVNRYMYATDEPAGGKRSCLRSDLLRDVVFSPGLRPAVPRRIVERFERKRQRLHQGYSPSTARDLLDWAQERVAIPASEWARLLEAVRSDHDLPAETVLPELAGKLSRIVAPEAAEALVVATESAQRVAAALYGPGATVRLDVLSADGRFAPGRACRVEPRDDADELPAAVLGQYLQFYGPRTAAAIRAALGIDAERLRAAVDDLAESERIVAGELTADAEAGEDEICDSENFEVLLRLMRADAAPDFRPLGVEWLAPFLARQRGLIPPADGADALAGRIERLLCCPLPPGLWEAEVLPARLRGYRAMHLDALMQAGELWWVGTADKRVAFCFAGELDLMQPDDGRPEEASPDEPSAKAASAQRDADLADLFADPRGRYDFATLARAGEAGAQAVADRLWQAAWHGRVTNDTFAALRRGITTRFRMPPGAAAAPAAVGSAGRPARAAFRRLRRSRPFAGNWFILPRPAPAADLLEIEERKKDRARLLLDRYGVVFRELLQREAPPLRWAAVFRSLRLMELSGEVLAGCFFHGVSGPQFASRKALAALKRGPPADAVFWLCAADPACLCGVELSAVGAALPKRLPRTHLVYRGPALVVVSRRNGRQITVNAPPDDPRLPEYFQFLHHLLTREFQPVRRITVETINGAPAGRSDYVDALRGLFDVMVDLGRLVLFRRMN